MDRNIIMFVLFFGTVYFLPTIIAWFNGHRWAHWCEPKPPCAFEES